MSKQKIKTFEEVMKELDRFTAPPPPDMETSEQVVHAMKAVYELMLPEPERKHYVVDFSLFSSSSVSVRATNEIEARKLAREILNERLIDDLIPFEEIYVWNVQEEK